MVRPPERHSELREKLLPTFNRAYSGSSVERELGVL